MGNNLGTKGMAGGRKKDVLIRGKHGDRRDDSVQVLIVVVDTQTYTCDKTV